MGQPVRQAPGRTVRARPQGTSVIPAGTCKKRSNDITHRFRAATEYTYLTGDQTE